MNNVKNTQRKGLVQKVKGSKWSGQKRGKSEFQKFQAYYAQFNDAIAQRAWATADKVGHLALSVDVENFSLLELRAHGAAYNRILNGLRSLPLPCDIT